MVEKKAIQAGYVSEPLKTGNTVINNVVTASDVAISYDKLWYDATKAIYGVAKDFIQADQAIELRKEQNRISKTIMDGRAEFSKEWDSPEKINYNDAGWVKEKNNQLALLREKEFKLISESRLENPIKDKFAVNSNDHYTEAHLKHQFDFGDFTRKTNISSAQKEIEDNLALIGYLKTDAEKDMLINSINNSREVLLNYSVDPTMVDKMILDGLADSMTAGTKDAIDSMFDANSPDAAYAMANDYLIANSQKYVSLIGRMEGLKEQEASKLADVFYGKQKTSYSGYIDRQRRAGKKRLEIEARTAKRLADAAGRKTTAAQKKDDKIDEGVTKEADQLFENDRSRRKAGDWEGVVNNYTGRDYLTDEFLNDPEAFEYVYGVNIDEAGLSQEIYKVLDKSDRSFVKEEINRMRGENISDDEIFSGAIDKYAEEKSQGVDWKKKLILKDIADEVGVNPGIILSPPEERKAKFKINEEIKAAKNVSDLDITTKIIDNGTWLKTKASKRYEELLNEVGNNSINKQKLDKWIQGKLVSNLTHANAYKTNPGLKMQKYLEDDANYQELKNELPAFYDLQIKNTSQYKPARMPFPEKGERPKKGEKKPLEENTEEKGAFSDIY